MGVFGSLHVDMTDIETIEEMLNASKENPGFRVRDICDMPVTHKCVDERTETVMETPFHKEVVSLSDTRFRRMSGMQ